MPGGSLARNLSLTVVDERSSHGRRERHFRDPVELESLVHLERVPARKRDHRRQDGVRDTGGHWVRAHHFLVKVFAEPFVGACSFLAGDDDLAREGVGLLPKLVLGKEHIHVYETVTATEQIRDEEGVQALADTARAHRDECAHDAHASQRQASGTPRGLRCERRWCGGTPTPYPC